MLLALVAVLVEAIINLGPELVKQVREIEPKFKPPFYLYAWVILLSLLVVMIIIIAPK
jgi:hypothetical protein